MDTLTCQIIDSTMREGEQFLHTSFSSGQKRQLASLLNDFGIPYLEVTNPCASPRSFQDCKMLAQMGLKSKILAHIRCHLDDAKAAVDAGAQGVNMVIGTSAQLRRYSHGKSLDEIAALACQVISWLKGQQVEIRFSTEDSLRSNTQDLIRLYRLVDGMGIDRVGIADTVGVGTPDRIGNLVRTLRPQIRADIEFHGHNDTGCAVANAYAALAAGATHIDCCVLGIGERNGITPLGGLIARLHATSSMLTAPYDLPLLKELDALVANIAGVEIPFNNCITGTSAFVHKAGIHTKAVLNHPGTYEVLDPADFGLTRTVQIAHKLTGHHAIGHRARQLGIHLEPDELRSVTRRIKAAADQSPLTMDTADAMIRRAAAGAAVIEAGTLPQEVRDAANVS